MPSISRSGGSMKFHLDDRQVKQAVDHMEANSGKVMAETIKEALREQATKTQRFINSSVPSRQRVMGQKVADSIAVEIYGDGKNIAEVAFGSDPMQEGGVTGSRGGKLAIMLESGVKPFEYGFTFKTIKPSPSFGIGSTGLGSFINAKANPVHGGFEAIGWLAQAYAEVVPEIEERLIVALQEAFA
tara:strand:+ start:223 stop:780 length:558 start_codon:yes stop_codon:yes gene_type:complete